MLDRLNLYEILAAVVPGALFVCAGAVLFPDAAAPFREASLPDEFAVVALLAASMLAGLVVQTVGSALERPLLRLFGGRPSDLALNGTLGNRYLPSDAAERIAAKLRTRFGERASTGALFLGAMSLAESSADSRTAAFNAQYGHLRAVFTLFLAILTLVVTSRFLAAAAGWSSMRFWATIGLCIVLIALFAWRTWQRGAYYARGVLLTAERLVDLQSSSTGGGSENAAQQSS